jgi:hypothetical protein
VNAATTRSSWNWRASATETAARSTRGRHRTAGAARRLSSPNCGSPAGQRTSLFEPARSSTLFQAVAGWLGQASRVGSRAWRSAAGTCYPWVTPTQGAGQRWLPRSAGEHERG